MDMISIQKDVSFEVINVDCSSTDGTFEVINEYEVSSYQIQAADYIPGKVLNEAIKRSNGQIIVFNNSDCIPQDENWLANLIAPLNELKCGAVFARQVSRNDARPLVVKDMERAFGDGNFSKKWNHFFSLASSATRRDVIEQIQFNDKIQYSEDILWSRELVNNGYYFEYVPTAIVEHSHNYSLIDVHKRFLNEGIADYTIWARKPSFFSGFVIPCLAEIVRDNIYLLKTLHVTHIPYGVAYRFLQRYSHYQGLLSARRSDEEN
jgi:rhamnosyltransferase